MKNRIRSIASVTFLLFFTEAFAEELFKATPLTKPGEFTKGIEGPACDKAGNVFAVNFKEQGTIGRVSPDGKGEVFLTLPEGSTGNGIRFDKKGNMFIADYPKHNVMRVDAKTKKLTVLAHEPRMNQPNDLAIDAKGNLYASDPSWAKVTGQLDEFRVAFSVERSTAGADGYPLEHEHGHRQVPTLVDVTEDVARRNPDVAEEDLIEAFRPGDLDQWPDFDAGRTKVDDEHRQALVLGQGGIGTGHHEAVVTVVGT